MLSVQKRIAAIAHDEQEKARTIEQLKFQIKDIDAKLKPYFKELGLDFPFA